MTTTYDIAVIGAGAVGSAMARELSRYQLKVALIESNPDVGMGTSKASTAIWHTGFDAKPGTLEATLMHRSYALMDQYLVEANIAHERLGALLIAWNQDQLDSLPALEKKAHENGVMDVRIISSAEIHQREPHINTGALGGLLVPGEGILCTFGVPLAFAYQAVLNDVELFLNFRVKEIRPTPDEKAWIIVDGVNEIHARYIVNAAGLFSDEINAHFGKSSFTVTPRRGQLIVYDKLARNLVNHVLRYKSPHAHKMAEALAIIRQRAPDLEVEGEMRGDVALSEGLRTSIFPESRLGGAANLLIMPNVDAANISYTLLKMLTNGVAIGPIMLGLAQPAHVLTPSSAARRIINMSAIAAVDAQEALRRTS